MLGWRIGSRGRMACRNRGKADEEEKIGCEEGEGGKEGG